jgi:predicted nucleotidyltransferase
MFTPAERASLRKQLLEFAKSDQRISAAAITGSAAANREDEWSDIDLAFAVADPEAVQGVLSDWTARMYDLHEALHHTDVIAGAWIYRVYFLANTLQVDLAFVSQSEFRAVGPTFMLIFGKENEPRPFPPPSAADIIGMGWLHALHARSCIARRKLWQAEHMISAVRDYALVLACLRLGLPSAHGRSIDQLSSSITGPLEASLVKRLEPAELQRAFTIAVEGFISEMRNADPELALKLEAPLSGLPLCVSDGDL